MKIINTIDFESNVRFPNAFADATVVVSANEIIAAI